MIRFFRQLRQKLLQEKKLANYLIYALGEIILVVIGILIALQINNVNEAKKDRAVERQMLLQIQENLGKDKEALKAIATNYKQAFSSAEKVLSKEESLKYPDSIPIWLANIIQFKRFKPITNSYESLKSIGLDKVSSNDLRVLLGYYYDDKSITMMSSVADIEEAFKVDWLPILKENVVEFIWLEKIVVDDLFAFSTPSTLRNTMILFKDNYRGGLVDVTTTIELIEKIEGELESVLNAQ